MCKGPVVEKNIYIVSMETWKKTRKGGAERAKGSVG